MVNLADQWHDPSGPVRPEPRKPDAGDGLAFVIGGYIAALDRRYEAAARSAGLPEHIINLILGRPTSQD